MGDNFVGDKIHIYSKPLQEKEILGEHNRSLATWAALRTASIVARNCHRPFSRSEGKKEE